jgi:hypothetical protein
MKMSIESKIREIAEEKFAFFSYVFEDWNGAAEQIDRVSLPAIVCILPVGGYLNFSRGLVKDREDCILAFVDKVSRDANGEDNEQVYSLMKEKAAGFITALNESHYFEPIDGNVKYTTILESASAYFTGVFVELTLKELQGACL